MAHQDGIHLSFQVIESIVDILKMLSMIFVHIYFHSIFNFNPYLSMLMLWIVHFI